MMPAQTSTNILTLTNTQAKDLAGRFVTIGAETYYFKGYDRDHPGQPPWRSGAEGKAYPLLDGERRTAAYLKFFTRPTQKRLDRTAWLIGQNIHAWLPGLAAAPLAWVDTRHAERPAAAALDFAGYLARAVPGKTWLELKQSLQDQSIVLSDDFRRHCLRDLALALAMLEQTGIIHGDLSPNNIVIDLAARPEQTALYLIDFDAFVAAAAEENRAVAVAEGGTYGTAGYCPPDLAALAAAGDGAAAPYSDRYGRDMLMLELLAVDRGSPADSPPASWSSEQLHRGYAACLARGDAKCLPSLAHLAPATLLTLEERERPTSSELAIALGLALPVKQPLRRTTLARSALPAVLGASPTSAQMDWQAASAGRRKAPAAPGFMNQWRWSRVAATPGYRTVWQTIRLSLGCALPAILLLAIGLIRLIYELYRGQ